MINEMFDALYHFANDVSIYLAEGGMAGLTAIGVYWLKKRTDERALRCKLGNMLGVEMEVMSETLTPIRLLERFSQDFEPVEDFPRAIYDGLVSSGNISNFSRKMQEKLHYFYRHEKAQDFEVMFHDLPDMISEVECFIRQNIGVYIVDNSKMRMLRSKY